MLDPACGRRLPWFTLGMMIALGIVAAWTGSLAAPLPDGIRAWAGFDARHLWSFSWHRIAVSIFFTAGAWRFWVSLLSLAACVGALEVRVGTLRTVFVFWLVHVLTLVVMAVVVAPSLAAIENALGRNTVIIDAVGPSAGYYGCLGVFVATLRDVGWRRLGATAISLVLIVQGAGSLADSGVHAPVLQSVLAHAIAVAIGFLVVARWAPVAHRLGTMPE